MKCARCLNTDPKSFYKGSKGWYCRKCIGFGRAMLEEEREPIPLKEVTSGSEEYQFIHPLTKAQALLSSQCAMGIEAQDVLLHCACGVGKTELVIESIAKFLKQKKKVGFAIPRRQVVLELKERLTNYFPNAKVVGVCGGHTQEIDGDLIICTTHQLYRYYQAFDLLILDEPDAYPFHNNPVLFGIAKTSCRGRMIYLTATPDTSLMNQVHKGTLLHLELNQRPHGYPLIVPKIKNGFFLLRWIWLLQWLKKRENHPRIVFVPTIAMAKQMGYLLSIVMECQVCTSQSEDKDELIASFRKSKNGLIIATTVLERGVTIPGVDVCVYAADHPVFSLSSLIQMAGRVGRSFEQPSGDVLFLLREKRELVEQCQKEIERMNQWSV